MFLKEQMKSLISLEGVHSGHALDLLMFVIQCVWDAFGYRLPMRGCDHTMVAVHRPWQQSDSSVQMVGCSVAWIWTSLLSHSRIDCSGLGLEGREWLIKKLACCVCLHVHCTVCLSAHVDQHLHCSRAVLDDGSSLLRRCAEVAAPQRSAHRSGCTPTTLTHSSQHRYSEERPWRLQFWEMWSAGSYQTPTDEETIWLSRLWVCTTAFYTELT